MMKFTPLYLSLALFIFCSHCSFVSSSELSKIKGLPPSQTLTLWALSDIQPKNQGQRDDFVKAIEDVNRNIPNIDFAVVAGDIVQRTRSEAFRWYLGVREGSYIGEWHEIAGNHDLKSDGGRLFMKYINPATRYSFAKGNLLFVLMSDEQKGSPTEISEETFEWWRGLVESNQDKIIVVVTHAPLEGSNIPLSNTRRRHIKDSWRFREVLKEHRVDLWISGHNHLPHWFAGEVGRVRELGGTVFVNASSIRREAWGLKPSESRIITFVCGSDEVLIRSRNHTNAEFNWGLDRTYRLSKPYECEG